MTKKQLEIVSHLLFWGLILTSINIEWTENWFDPSIRPKSPAPLSLFIFAFYFYGNAFYLIPEYFALDTWKKYLLGAVMLFIAPEIIRIFCYEAFVRSLNLEAELFSRDSFVFGTPSPFFFALNSSFVYSLTKAWFLNKEKIKSLEKAAEKKPVPYEDVQLLTEVESQALKKDIIEQLSEKQLYLNPELSLKNLADSVGSTEKKVSYLINQNLQSSFYEFVNQYRIEHFKKEVTKPENNNFSIVGLALNCGFPSKSSFYRAFKAQVSMSPSEYIKHIQKKS